MPVFKTGAIGRSATPPDLAGLRLPHGDAAGTGEFTRRGPARQARAAGRPPVRRPTGSARPTFADGPPRLSCLSSFRARYQAGQRLHLRIHLHSFHSKHRETVMPKHVLRHLDLDALGVALDRAEDAGLTST